MPEIDNSKQDLLYLPQKTSSLFGANDLKYNKLQFD